MQVADRDPEESGIADAMSDARCWVGKWLVDFESHRLVEGDEETKLTLKASGVLRELTKGAGEPVTREQLLNSVWAGTVPTDDVLSQAVSELRKALHDDPRDSHYIETITKVGYRLVADVKPVVPQGRRAASRKHSRNRWLLPALAIIIAIITYFVVRQDTGMTPMPQSLLGTPGLGGDLTPVSTEPGMEMYPAISPDSLHIVYSGRDIGSADFDLFLKSTDTLARRRLTSDATSTDVMSTWSPDGTEVAFLRLRDGDCGINIAPIVGGFTRRVGDCMKGAVSWLDWSPDGRFLAYPQFTEDNPDAVQIHQLNLRTGQSAPLEYNRIADEHDVAPRYSPNGEWMVFRRGAYPYGSLYVMPATGGPLRNLATLNAAVHGIDWLGDSSGLVFSSNHLGRDAIFMLRLESGAISVIDWRAAHGISLSSDNTLTFSTNNADGNLLEYSLLSDTSQKDWFNSTRSERAATLAPDGTKIAFISDRSGFDQIWLGDKATGKLMQISDLTESVPEAPVWSGDGRLLAYTVRHREGALVRISEIATGETYDELGNVAGLGGIALSNDGRQLVYAANQDRGWRLWRKTLKSNSEAEVLADGSGRTPAAGPSDDYIYYTRPHGTGLWRVPASGGTAQRLTDAFKFRSRRGWDVAADGIYFITVTSGISEIRRITWQADTPEFVTSLGTSISPADLDVHPDGSSVLVTRLDNRQADVMQARNWQR